MEDVAVSLEVMSGILRAGEQGGVRPKFFVGSGCISVNGGLSYPPKGTDNLPYSATILLKAGWSIITVFRYSLQLEVQLLKFYNLSNLKSNGICEVGNSKQDDR